MVVTSRFDKGIDKHHKYMSAKSAEVLLPMYFDSPTRCGAAVGGVCDGVPTRGQ
jgi:hypothetical protein